MRLSSVGLKQAIPEQSDIVFTIIKENAHWLQSKEIFQWPLDWLESEKQEIYKSIKIGNYYLFEIGNEVAAVVELKSEDKDLWDNDHTNSLYVHKLAIRRKYSGSGLGIRVLNEIKLRAVELDVSHLRLDCVAHNRKLRSYYESFGFELIRERNNGVINLALYEFTVKSSQENV